MRLLSLPILLSVVLAASPARAQNAAGATRPSEQHHHAGDGKGALFSPRDASGTAWLPDETPMYGVERRWGTWAVMFHGTGFAQFLYESGNRHRTGGFSSHQVSSVNWAMMARRPAGAGRFGVRAMVSAEPWTVNDCGFINLLANGEMCQGDTIHDRQHPHDLFMELAADYDRPLRGTVRWQVYAGLAGEPALGPAGFPHRPSAAHLREAEAEFSPQPRSDVERATASATYHAQAGAGRLWATTLAYGVNAGREVIPGDAVYLVTHAVLLESSLTLRDRHTWFGRVEAVGKAGHDLHAHEWPARVFPVGKMEAGYVRYFKARKGLVPGVGGLVSVTVVPEPLAPRYSGHVAPGFGVFFTVRPPRHATGGVP